MENGLRACCCICRETFVEMSQPRMMRSCPHNACTLCIKQEMCKDTKTIICVQCGSKQKLQSNDIEYFPKNLSLIKVLREKNPQSVSSNNQSSRDTLSSFNQAESQFCQIHKKHLEIICLNDRVKLCAHCAIFGAHKDHQFKTITALNEEMDQRRRQFQYYKCRKSALEDKLRSNEFKESVARKIGEEKDRLVSEIKRKFSKIIDNIKLAQKKAYEDVVKNFKAIYSQISALIKEENQSHKKYKLWELKCTQLFQKADKLIKIEDKAALHFQGPLQICKQGEFLLSRLESQINLNISSIEALISQIKIVENNGICNSVFNYINVVLQDKDECDLLGSVHQQVFLPKQTNQARKQKIQFGPSHLTSQRLSLTPINKKKGSQVRGSFNKVSSDRKLSPKGTPSEQKVAIDSLIEQFCQRENLDTLDLTGYSLTDSQIYDILAYIKPLRKVKGLKLVKNKLTNEGLQRIVELISSVTNLNLSFNQLGDESMITLLDNRSKIPTLRIINLSNNKINERRTKSAIEQLKKQGLIVTI